SGASQGGRFGAPRPPAIPLAPAPPAAPPPGLRLAEIDELDLRIEKLVAGGDGLGRLDGVPIFVPRTAPGDRVRVRLVERRPDYGRGEVVELLAPGAGRREPPCPHFADCGGCDLQHLEVGAQLRAKALAAAETLARIARIELPRPDVIAGDPWRYRIRTQLHTRRSGGGWEVGYYARGSRRLVPIRECRVLVPELEEAALGLASRLGDEAPERIDLAVGDEGSVAAAPPAAGLEGGELHRTVAGFPLAYDARCFFQGHVGLLETLVERAVGSAEGELAFDLYGGVGLFALPLARRYRRVVTVEADRVAGR
ncbi:MAG: class I SAM-dependent RNA methyltransferase, partial [Acidobacteria bacterium]|nr:class I SAM-dependent RNA methyltransferase [Acidobacteriota bacterium]